MTNQNTQTVSDSGGASLGSVPQVPVIFSYALWDGDINVYIAQTSHKKFVVISFFPRTYRRPYGEIFYDVRTLPGPASFIARSLVSGAAQAFEAFEDEENPFEVLLSDTEAMEKLEDIINRLGW